VVFFPLTAGGLTNKQAFQENAPFWASQAEAGFPNGTDGAKGTKGSNEISAETSAATVEKQNKQSMSELNMTTVDGSVIERESVTAAQNEVIDLRAKLAEADKAIKSQRKKEATAAVQAAVRKGTIPAQNTELQAKWQGWLEEKPEMVETLEGIPGVAAVTAGQMTNGRPTVAVNEGAVNTVKAYGRLQADQKKINGMGPVEAAQRGAIAREAAQIYASIRKNLDEFGGMPITAATTTDSDLGSLAGELIAQRTLELLKYQFPILSRITCDFSEQPASFNQTIMTRFMTVPDVTSYSTSVGWTTIAAGATPKATDAQIVINNHKGVPLRFHENQLAGTMRRLFDEFAPAASYALALDMVTALYALITAANYTAASIKADKASFGRGEVIDIGVALNKARVPMGPQNRTLLLNSDYFGQLAKDNAIVTLSAFQRPEIMEQGVLPNVHGFSVVDAPNLPATGNLTGFAFSKSALLIAARLPNDYSSILPGSGYGSVTTITDPDLGLSVMQTQYVDHKLGFAESRMALMYGVGVGQAAAAQRLVSA